MIHLTIILALLTILAALYLLAKFKNEGLSSFIKWSTYGVIIIATLVIICNLAQGIRKMRCHEEECVMIEKSSTGMHEGMGDCKMMGSGMHGGSCNMQGGSCNMHGGMDHGMCNEMSGCCGMCGHGDMNCEKGEGHKGCSEGDESKEGGMKSCCMHGDSTMKKEIHKEIRIEKK